MIKIVAYDPAWPAHFEAEASKLRATFGELALRIEHVGSTSVPGLAAKAVIDIQVSVASLASPERFLPLLAQLGYLHVPMGDFDLVYPWFVKPHDWPSTHHVHLCVQGDEQERRHLAFRDHLRCHPEVAAEYVALKRSLAAANHGRTLESRECYSLSKTGFVESVLARALAMPPPPLKR
jgi:GrpB-like predicted nucleotidyltransferase (UPF0157 family)